MRYVKAIAVLLGVGMLVTGQQSFAEQVVMLDTGTKPTVSVLAKQPFLVEFAVGKVYRIDGRNGIDWMVDPDRDVMKDLGKVVVEPITNKPFTLMVTRDDGRTFELGINPVTKGGSEHLVLKSALVGDYQSVSEDPIVSKNLVSAKSRDKTIRVLIEAMANNKPAKGFTRTTSDNRVSLWKEATVIETSLWKGMGLTGKVWTLTNTSNQEMTLDEREFYFEQVAAVAIVKPVLQPKESTRVLMVMETGNK